MRSSSATTPRSRPRGFDGSPSCTRSRPTSAAPHPRGNPPRPPRARSPRGSIPARAGEPPRAHRIRAVSSPRRPFNMASGDLEPRCEVLARHRSMCGIPGGRKSNIPYLTPATPLGDWRGDTEIRRAIARSGPETGRLHANRRRPASEHQYLGPYRAFLHKCCRYPYYNELADKLDGHG